MCIAKGGEGGWETINRKIGSAPMPYLFNEQLD